MGFLLKRKRTQLKKPTVLATAAAKLAAKTTSFQRKMALRLDSYFDRLPLRRKKLVLLGFTLVFGGMSLIILFQTFLSPSPGFTKIHKIQIPPHIGRASKDRLYPPATGVFHDYEDLNKLLQQMDSLSATKDGQRKFDSFIKANPGIRDTIGFLEKSLPSLIKQ